MKKNPADISSETEKAIKMIAKKLFFQDGRLNATMQDIADEIGINRAMLNYYFRSRDKLFTAVLQEAIEETFINALSVAELRIPFEEKVALAVGTMVDSLQRYPYIDNFIVSELNKDSGLKKLLRFGSREKANQKQFLSDTKKYFKGRGHTRVSAEHFLVNMIALCSYPAFANQIIKVVLSLNEKEFQKFMNERKRVICSTLLARA